MGTSETQPTQPESHKPLISSETRLHRLWQGGGKPAILWKQLFQMVFSAFLIGFCYTLTLSTLRWTMPVKLVGVVCLLLTITTIIWFFRSGLRVFLHLGLKRLLIRLGCLYIIVIILTSLFTPTGGADWRQWLSNPGIIAQWTASHIGNLSRALLSAPDDIRFATTGKRNLQHLPDIEWVGNVPPTPIVINAITENGADVPALNPTANELRPTDTTSPALERPLRVGDSVRVVGTDGVALRGHETPSISAQVVIRFPPGSAVQIIDGPQMADGKTWWKVKDEHGEGWCAAEFLAI